MSLDIKGAIKHNLSDINRISMNLDDSIYLDFDCNILQDYEVGELDQIKYNNLFFTILSYHSRKDLFVVLKAISNYRDVIIDDDQGYIGSLAEYIKSYC